MTVELPARVEQELRGLAVAQRRDMADILEDAIRLYLEASAITDLGSAEVAEAQAALIGELRGIDEWKE